MTVCPITAAPSNDNAECMSRRKVFWLNLVITRSR